MENYSNAKIYKIISKNTKKIYIGSTSKTLKHRLSTHIKDFKRNHYCSSRELILLGDYEIVLIELYSCKNNLELRMREQFWMDKFKFDGCELVNKRNAYLSEEELKEHTKQYGKKYYEENKNEITLKFKQYWKENKNELNQRNIKYNQENKIRIKQYKKQYYLDNKIFYKKIVVTLMAEFILDIQDF